MTKTTRFVNKTTVDIKLKEGNAGVYRPLKTLKGLANAAAEPGPDNSFTQEVDERATYREFRVASLSRQRFTKIITSDFILDNGVIYIEPNPQNPQEFEIRGDPRINGHNEPFTIVARVLNFFWRNRANH